MIVSSHMYNAVYPSKKKRVYRPLKMQVHMCATRPVLYIDCVCPLMCLLTYWYMSTGDH